MSALIVNFRPSEDGEWTAWAECAKPGATPMFPSDADTVAIEAAKDNCRACPVLVECLEAALKRGESWGIWGGLTPDERNAIRRNVTRQARRTGEPRATAAELANEAARKFTANPVESEQTVDTEAGQLDEAAGQLVSAGAVA